jgi:hypothetical protein
VACALPGKGNSHKLKYLATDSCANVAVSPKTKKEDTLMAKRKKNKNKNKNFYTRVTGKKALAAIDDAFVLMLDIELDMGGDFWPVAASAAAIDELRGLFFVPEGRRLIPKALFEAVFLEPKTLLDGRSHQPVSAGIYQLRST